jgi:hypothetical protein
MTDIACEDKEQARAAVQSQPASALARSGALRSMANARRKTEPDADMAAEYGTPHDVVGDWLLSLASGQSTTVQSKITAIRGLGDNSND